jgi:hypothetical protein
MPKADIVAAKIQADGGVGVCAADLKSGVL